MSRRSQASLLAVALLVLLVGVASQLPVPYVTASPGPTVNVLGEQNGSPIVEVRGHRTYPTEGQLRLTTVSVTRPDREVNLVEAVGAWLRSDTAVVPFESMYPGNRTAEEERAESAAQMANSQDTAIASALSALGYDLTTYAEVIGVNPGGPSDGTLEARDRILELEGDPIDGVQQVFDALEDAKPGDEISGVVQRGTARKSFTVTTEAASDDPDRAVLGVFVGTGYDFPFEVEVDLGEAIGGPSAGLVFALSIYDTLTPGSLTDGRSIAGSGTIAADGSVGPIGHIAQKIVGARDAGATLFLVPPDNCDSAVTAAVDPDEIRLVRAPTLASAIDSLEKYAQDPTADLPRCPQ